MRYRASAITVLLLVVGIVAFGLPQGMWAQAVLATVTGQVSDATGARIVGAVVTITNPDTNISNPTETKPVTEISGKRGRGFSTARAGLTH